MIRHIVMWNLHDQAEGADKASNLEKAKALLAQTKYKDGFDVKPNLPPEASEQDDRAEPEALEAADLNDEWFELPPEKEGDKIVGIRLFGVRPDTMHFDRTVCRLGASLLHEQAAVHGDHHEIQERGLRQRAERRQ